MAKTLCPRNGLVIVRIMESDAESKTASGIIVPRGKAGTTFEVAEVVAVGRGTLLDSPTAGEARGVHGGTDDLKPGMLVLLKAGVQGMELGQRANSYLELEQDGKDKRKLQLINQTDILVIIEQEKS